MAQLITSGNCFEGWSAVSNYLINVPGHQDTNVLVVLDSPCNFGQLKNWINKYNPKSIEPGEVHLRQVINTIFPYSLSSYFNSREELYSRYSKIYSAARRKKWGTYFQRLISFGKGIHEGHENQLENAIQALLGESPQKFYITFHLTASNVESNVRPLGGPCWQFGEIIINEEGKVDLVAVYRNHDYFGKGLGNYIGLAKLLEFICLASGRVPGKLIIHSIHAYSSRGVSKLSQLLS